VPVGIARDRGAADRVGVPAEVLRRRVHDEVGALLEQALVDRRGERVVDREWISDTVFEVADGILGQGFEPTPSYAACSMCDYRIACPAAER
jgi:hypothetical protein